MMKRVWALATIALAAAAYGCSSGAVAPVHGATNFAYVSNFAGAGSSQIAIFGLPVTASSVPTIVTPAGLQSVTALTFDASGNLWAVNDFTTAAVTGYGLPLSNASTPIATINIPGAMNPNAIAFDKSGNMWVTDAGKNNVFEFTPPFSGSITPAPAVTITSVTAPTGLAFDAAGNLYVSKGVFGSGAIEIFNPPFSNGQLPTASPLTGSVQPGALAFDAAGNLYTLNTNGDIDRFNAPTAGGKPVSIRLSGGNTLITNFGGLAFDSAGSLYATNISSPQLYLFANAATTFSGNMPVPLVVLIAGFGTNGSGGVAVR